MIGRHLRPLWPRPADSPRPEPLASCLHFYVLADVDGPLLGLWPEGHGPLQPNARWPAILQAQLVKAARGEDGLRSRLLEHPRLLGPSVRGALSELDGDAAPTEGHVTGVLVNLVAQNEPFTGQGASLAS